MTERVRSQMQASEMRFLQKIKGVITMFDKLRNNAILESFNIKSLLLRIERSQLRWFGYVRRMPKERKIERFEHKLKIAHFRLTTH